MNDMNTSRGWTRRGLLQGSAAAMAAAYGMRPAHTLAEIPIEFDGSKFQLAAPEPNPKHGGVLRVGILNRPPHFDFHQSGTVGNIGTQGCMFDNLIRHDPRDSGKTIIPDLAHSWEISKDGKTYTFFLRKGVQFHDGAELTSDDVKATFDRIRKPPQGVSIPRSILFKAVNEIAAPDKYTVQFKLEAPRPASFIMAAIASGWNGIVRKKTLEENGYNLRKVPNIPGTGPFKTTRRVENEVWVVEKNKDYWNKGLPYLDGIEFYNLIPFSPELGAAILSNRVDYARIVDPVTARKAKATPGMSTTAFNQSVIQATYTNDKKKPFDDPRVRRAFHLVLDRHVLVDVVKDVAPMQVGGFIYPFSEFATPKPTAVQARRLSGRSDRGDQGGQGADGRRRSCQRHQGPGLHGPRHRHLQALGAGHPGDGCSRHQCGVQPAHGGGIGMVRRCGERAFRSRVGAIVSTLLDPSDYFNAWYRTGGPQNYSFWDNAKFNALVDQIDEEVDPAKRKALIRQAEAIMEQDPPVLPVCWEQINDVWWNYVKGYNPYDYFGIYDVVREDIFWLDKA